MEIIGFEELKNLYATDEDFHTIWAKCATKVPCSDYHVQQGYLFKGNKLCISCISLREKILRNLYVDGLSAHSGRDNPYALISDQFYWSRIYRDVVRFIQRYLICQTPKG
ncbi:hypothetical protein PanWU01x14_143130 [Parasponia andersonii]|uniref:Integrase zinc-binding domain-containing protein n=1 Tax=Parasponia andersonii TaxID=3476 RepID=A0A2P5CKT5_PARAD|nr:hypothetical protein PanWU01x14_143130 [Parasponia andersonii]